MSGPDRCPACGAERPEGVCPACTIGPGLVTTQADARPDHTTPNPVSDDPGSTLQATQLEPAGEFETLPLPSTSAGASILASLATLAPVPRISLREPGAPPDISPPPARVDPNARYQLLGEIGRGGMGAVHHGKDHDLGRDLAVKVLLGQHLDRPELVQRFVEEAQIGGQLQHPGIVPVYELGAFPDRRPYFTMKLVKGRTLGAMLLGRASPMEDLPRFLTIFEQICQTIAYAHARGVIHRDLKPANIMVGHFGEVQVMDWGLAKVLDPGVAAAPSGAARPGGDETSVLTTRQGSRTDSELTQAGSVFGTPAYMAPEQARGEIDQLDQRADVFGLGAVLCEVLTGQPPYVGTSGTQILSKAAEADLTDAHARIAASGADPEVIDLARRCLAPERADRPPDAEAVARAVRGHLDGVQKRLERSELERVEAEARAAGERKRRKLQMGLAASVLALTVLGGLSVASWRQQRQTRAARVALAFQEAELLRDQAAAAPDDLERWTRAERAVERLATDLKDIDESKGNDRLAALQREVHEGLASSRRDRALVDALVGIRTSKEDLGLDGADASYARAFLDAGLDVLGAPEAVTGATLKARPGHVALAAAAGLDDWALVREGLGNLGSAWRRPLDVARVADPDPYRDRLRAAILNEDRQAREKALRALAADPKSAELPPASAVLLAQFLRGSRAYEPAVAVLRAAAGAHPDDVWVNYVLASALLDLRPALREEAVRYYSAARAIRPETAHELAHLLQAMGRGADAVAIFADLTARRPDDPRHLACRGEDLLDRGRRAEGLAVLRRAEEAARAQIDRKPEDSYLLNQLGNGLRARGDHAAAAAAFRDSIRLKPDLALAHRNLSLALYEMGDYPAAIAAGREATRLDPTSAQAHNTLGCALTENGQLDLAIAAFRTAVKLDPNDAEAHTSLSNALQLRGDIAGAIAAARQAIRNKPDLAFAHNNLGFALFKQGDVAGALAAYRDAVRINPNFILAQCNIIYALGDNRQYDAAVAAGREAARINPDSPEIHNALGVVLERQGNLAAAISAYREAVRRKATFVRSQTNLVSALIDHGEVAQAIAAGQAAARANPGSAEVLNALGYALYRGGDLAAAIDAYRKATRIKPGLLLAQVNLMNALRDQNDPTAVATAAMRLKARLEPDDADVRIELGQALQEQDDHVGALAAFREAVRLRPDSLPARQGVADASRDQGDPATADAYRAVVRLAPNDAEAHFELGNALARHEDVPGARAALEEAIRLQPDHVRAHVALGLVLSTEGDDPAALAVLRRAVALDPNFAPAHWSLGIALAVRADYVAAAACYREAIRLGSEEMVPYFNLGVILAEQGDFDSAIAMFRKTIDVDPNAGAAHANLAWALTEHPDPRRRDLRQALASARKAVSLDGKTAAYRSILGLVQLRSGDLAAARASVEAALKLQGDNADDFFLLAMIDHREGRDANARALFEKAAALFKKVPIPDAGRLRFQSELAAALGLPDPAPMVLPAEPFAGPR